MRTTLDVRPLQMNMGAHVQGATALVLPSV
jgi:hypothetical protein